MKNVRKFFITLVLIAFVGCNRENSNFLDLGSHPSTRELIEQFTIHSNEFNQIRQMLIEDQKLQRVALDFTVPGEVTQLGINEERLANYRKLFFKCGLSEGVLTFDPTNRVEYLVSVAGLSVHGSVKGIVFDATPTEVNIVTNLDSIAKPGEKDFRGYQRIIDNWWVYYER